jgi:hypothetical protein
MKKQFLNFVTLAFGLSWFTTSFAVDMSSIDVTGSEKTSLICFSDRGTEISLISGVSNDLKTNQYVFKGQLFQSEQVFPWTQPKVDFEFQIKAERDIFFVTQLESTIIILNPYIGELERLNQQTISYLEFHLLRDRLHDPNSSGFTSNEPSIGFGVQCFFDGL